MKIERLLDISKKQVLVFGDFMVDRYLYGNVNRISPEAPVPVISMEKEQLKLGGAGNVVNNLVSLGASVKVLGCIGNDKPGEFIIGAFSNDKINTSYFKQYDELQTIQKTRIVSKKQQFMRIDQENIDELPFNYYKFIEENIDEILSDVDSIVISDYAKGAVNTDFSQLIIKNGNKKNIPIIVDPKGSDYYKYKNATLCTPNMKELQDVCQKNINTEKEIEKYGVEITHKFNFKNLVITRSENGISLIDGKEKKDFPAKAKEVIDVSGAGDTVVSTIALLLTLNLKMEEVCILANLAASIVVSKFGTSTLSLDELVSTINQNSNFKLLDISTAKYVVNNLKQKDLKIVFTNGCFDLLHAGHLSSFKQAKKYGDILIVAVNSDDSVKKNKGDLRPIISEKDRIDMLCALEIVDFVILMNDKTPEKIISVIQPDVTVKGEDWKNKDVPEKKIVESYGGKMEFIKLEKGMSTTNIIDKIIKVYEK